MTSGGSMKLGVTAAIAVLATSLTCAYAFSSSTPGSSSSFTERWRRHRRRNQQDDYDYDDVPPEILNTEYDDDDFACECKDELILAVRIAQEG